MSFTGQRLIGLVAPVLVFAALYLVLSSLGSTGSEAARSAPAATMNEAASLARRGDDYYQRGRETGLAKYPRLAGRAYDDALTLDPDSVPALVGKATIALVAHDFPGGLALARRAQRLEPDIAATYPPLIDGLIETGRYAEAARAIDRLLRLKPGPPAYARLSYFEELHGNQHAALRAMRLAAESALPGTEASSFGHALVGELLFDAGRYDAAARSYRTALVGNPRYVHAEAGALNVAAARGECGAAIAGYRELVEKRGLVEYSDELGRLEEVAGDARAAARHYGAISRLHARELASGQRPDAGQVLFEADHGVPATGVRLGRAVWRASPSVSSADAYAWALHAAGKPAAALAMSERAARLGTRDPLFRFHAGMIAAEGGQPDRARAILAALLRRSPGFDPLFAEQARRELHSLG
jgi:tetratricopeptide (TPR) repeat protein